MYPYLRLALVLASAVRKQRIPLEEASSIPLRVGLFDLDMYGHMNNGRYLTMMDLGRADLFVRTGLLALWRQRSWYPVAGAASVRYRRSLGPLAGYRLETRILAWDDKWFYVGQRFLREDFLAAEGTVRFLFKGPQGNVPPSEVVSGLGLDPASPTPDTRLQAWIHAFDTARTEAGDPGRPR